MPSANIESDPFFTLLTDALRAGPGSPQWNDAVAALRQQGLESADEHRLLLDARENLEAGRDYRSVRAGTGFTRKVMQEIEQGGTGPKKAGIPTATIVASVCGLLILAAVGYLGWRMSSHEASSIQAQVADIETKSQAFVDQVADANFTASMPDGWHKIGSMAFEFNGEFFPSIPGNGTNPSSGGVVINQPIPSARPFVMDTSVDVALPTDQVILEVFVTTDGDFSANKATHDLVWQLRRTDEQVLVNGNGKLPNSLPYHANDLIRMIVGENVAILETVPTEGKPQVLWSGPHELGSGPRYVGVRFLHTGQGDKLSLGLKRIRINAAPGN